MLTNLIVNSLFLFASDRQVNFSKKIFAQASIFALKLIKLIKLDDQSR
jgi:hypothetical protein